MEQKVLEEIWRTLPTAFRIFGCPMGTFYHVIEIPNKTVHIVHKIRSKISERILKIFTKRSHFVTLRFFDTIFGQNPVS
jgi:hypothetical protein